MAAATLTFAVDSELPESVQNMGSLVALVGSFTFTGDYEAGGIACNLADLFERVGMGRVYSISSVRGYDLEYVAATDKVKVWVSAGTEHTAATLDTDLTGSAVRAVIIGR